MVMIVMAFGSVVMVVMLGLILNVHMSRHSIPEVGVSGGGAPTLLHTS